MPHLLHPLWGVEVLFWHYPVSLGDLCSLFSSPWSTFLVLLPVCFLWGILWLGLLHPQPRDRSLHWRSLNLYECLWLHFSLVINKISLWLIFRHPAGKIKLLMKWNVFHKNSACNVPRFMDVNLLIIIIWLHRATFNDELVISPTYTVCFVLVHLLAFILIITIVYNKSFICLIYVW